MELSLWVGAPDGVGTERDGVITGPEVDRIVGPAEGLESPRGVVVVVGHSGPNLLSVDVDLQPGSRSLGAADSGPAEMSATKSTWAKPASGMVSAPSQTVWTVGGVVHSLASKLNAAGSACSSTSPPPPPPEARSLELTEPSAMSAPVKLPSCTSDVVREPSMIFCPVHITDAAYAVPVDNTTTRAIIPSDCRATARHSPAKYPRTGDPVLERACHLDGLGSAH